MTATKTDQELYKFYTESNGTLYKNNTCYIAKEATKVSDEAAKTIKAIADSQHLKSNKHYGDVFIEVDILHSIQETDDADFQVAHKRTRLYMNAKHNGKFKIESAEGLESIIAAMLDAKNNDTAGKKPKTLKDKELIAELEKRGYVVLTARENENRVFFAEDNAEKLKKSNEHNNLLLKRLTAEQAKNKAAAKSEVAVTEQVTESDIEADIAAILATDATDAQKSMAIAKAVHNAVGIHSRAQWAKSMKLGWKILKSKGA